MSNTDTSEMEKYEILYQKDRDMTEFMNNFESNKLKELEMIKQLEENITILLDHASRTVDREENLPSYGQVEELKSDFEFKRGEMENAAVTQ
jgi:intraflagellar transport protein 74